MLGIDLRYSFKINMKLDRFPSTDKRNFVAYQQIVIRCFYVNSIMLGLVFLIVIPCF